MIESNLEKVERLISPIDEDTQLENTLRPSFLKEYVGQKIVCDNLEIAIKAAKERGEALDHTLLHGPPGLGKTTLAHIIARELQVNIRVTSGPALEKQGDVASVITNLEENDILFIDEIHRLKPTVEEVLYSAMEDFAIDLIIGKGPAARSMRLELPRFTLIGATTKISMLSSPLRDRFGNLFKLQLYEVGEMKQIILRSAEILGFEIEEGAAKRLAQSSRSTPRVGNRLLKRVRDYAQVFKFPQINGQVLDEALEKLGVDEFGLDERDREILKVMIAKFNGGPVGLSTLAAAISEERATLEDVYEPYLLQLGFLERSPRGRIATERAYEHLGL